MPSLMHSFRMLSTKDDLFGVPEQNVQYAYHHAELQFGSRKKVILRIGKVVLAEEGYRRKEARELQLKGHERQDFVDARKEKHAIELEELLGLEDGPEHRFLLGICFATSASVTTVPFLQKVIQADAAHMQIGKYTLFSAY
jgi:hypothetical protein